jgi:His-Xaa-Ser system protein HxsD
MELMQEISDGGLRLTVKNDLYRTETVLKAAHRFTSECYIKIDRYGDQLVIQFKPIHQGRAISEKIVDDFCNELIDQQVRAIVSSETGNIRDQIIKKAFSPIE